MKILEILLASGSFTAADIRLSGTQVNAATLQSGPTKNAANGTVYTATIRPLTQGTVIVTLDNTGVTDNARNPVASTGSTLSVTVIYDTSAPTVTVARADGETGTEVNANFDATFLILQILKIL